MYLDFCINRGQYLILTLIFNINVEQEMHKYPFTFDPVWFTQLSEMTSFRLGKGILEAVPWHWWGLPRAWLCSSPASAPPPLSPSVSRPSAGWPLLWMLWWPSVWSLPCPSSLPALSFIWSRRGWTKLSTSSLSVEWVPPSTGWPTSSGTS